MQLLMHTHFKFMDFSLFRDSEFLCYKDGDDLDNKPPNMRVRVDLECNIVAYRGEYENKKKIIINIIYILGNEFTSCFCG